MDHPRPKKTIVVVSVALGLVVLLAAAVTFKDRLIDEVYLYRLRTARAGERLAAANVLVERRCLRVMPYLLETCVTPRKVHFAYPPDVFGPCNCSSPKLLRQLGPRSIPALVATLDWGEDRQCFHALLALGKFGPEGRPGREKIEQIARSERSPLSEHAAYVLRRLDGETEEELEKTFLWNAAEVEWPPRERF